MVEVLGTVCSRYGPYTVALRKGRIVLNPSECPTYVQFEELLRMIDLGSVDEKLLLLASIPPGTVTTYRLYGETVGLSPRAVGRLLASNPYPVLLPCHRVVRSDMSLGGYMFGQEVKRGLLEFEGALAGGKPHTVVRPRRLEDVLGALLEGTSRLCRGWATRCGQD